MPLKLYNTASMKTEKFKELQKGEVKIYVCGVTPYDTTHLGHAFTYVFFDTLVRYLKFKGFKVTYTQNVTDIDDDIIRRSREEGKDWRELGKYWTDRYLKDMESLNVSMPDYYVRATESIDKIIEMVSALIHKKFAYLGNGNVYFDVSKFPAYGKLSHFNDKQMRILLKERGGDPDDKNKRNPLDFVLWLGHKEGEPCWDASFGRGRPGWHIECSAMINQYLGDRIDIHGGGRDLAFPHHESEIAQSESFTGKRPFVGYFMHTGMVMYMGEKMAKSLGNLIMVSELLKSHSPNSIRWLLLSHHYRRVWEYADEEMEKADGHVKKADMLMKKGSIKGKLNKELVYEFERIMDEDMNTPAALEFVYSIISEGKEEATAQYLLEVLGFARPQR
ncbi:MAG: cysteine--tRNA ligase [Candidatus Micrarchaeaceae archaeon]